MFLLKDNAILVFPAGLAVATFIVGGVPLVAEMFSGMSERLGFPGRCLVEGMAGALLAISIGVAVITLMRQEEHHREMMDDKALKPMDVNIKIEQIPERKGRWLTVSTGLTRTSWMLGATWRGCCPPMRRPAWR